MDNLPKPNSTIALTGFAAYFLCGVTLLLLTSPNASARQRRPVVAVPINVAAHQNQLPTSQEMVAHEKIGDFVSFSLSASPHSLRLQGLITETGRWTNLAVRLRPPRTLCKLKVPPLWRDAELRLVASYPSGPKRRDGIPMKIDWETRCVNFISTAGAKLFSIESKPEGTTAWSRVSTVAAPETPRAIRVPLPSSLKSGTPVRVVAVSGLGRTFPPLSTPLPTLWRGGLATFAANVQAVSSAPLASTMDAVAALAGDKGGSLPLAEESDIWRIRGSKIYFFNRLRGLQVIDAANPSDPFIAGSIPMAGAGEEMYLLGSSSSAAEEALLFTGTSADASGSESTRLTRLILSNDTPALQSSLDLPGYYIESRLVGNLVHVVTGYWTSDSGQWAPRTFVTTIEVSQGGALVELSRREFGFEARAVGSTAKYLWIAAQPAGAWSEQEILAFPFMMDGALDKPLQTKLGGVVQDKFKVGDTADGLAAVVQNWSDWQRRTSVETFRQDGAHLVRQAALELIQGESLFATRFEGKRLYVVTFEQVDPLWIVDLSEPSSPQVKGHLEVPGWSTYIQPVGDVLLAVGRDGGKVQVSMFDVSDVTNPRLAQRVDVGSGWSWSEAEWNEKAVKILPESGLILLPVVDWESGAPKNRVSLLEFDVAQRSLSARGSINHEFAPRRAALMDNGVIASVSNRQLLLIDASNLDVPVVASDVALAFGVNRMVTHDNVALMFEDGSGGLDGASRPAVLRTAPLAAPDAITAELPLPCADVCAASVVGRRLVVVESSASNGGLWASTAGSLLELPDKSSLSVWSLADAAHPVLTGRAQLPFQVGADVRILPVDGGRVAIVSREQGWSCWVRPLPSVAASDTASVSGFRLGLPWIGWGGQGLRIAVSELSGAVPRIMGTWQLEGSEYADISEVFSSGELLAFSFDRRESVLPSDSLAPWTEEWSGWKTRSWLQIIDLANPEDLMPWAPVQLPGRLTGLSWLQRAGGVVFALSGQRVAALGFDGENASVVAEVKAGAAIEMEGSTLYAATETGVSEWHFSKEASRWEQGTGWAFKSGSGIQTLHVADGAILAGSYNKAWVLRGDGSASASALPAGYDLSSAAKTGEGFLVPAGDYGAVSLR